MIASVPSPTVNVLCASMEEEELAPMVFSLWPGSNGSDTKISGWPLKVDIPVYPDWLNRTAVDDLFGFGPKYGRRHPVFPKLPIEYNSVLNGSGAFIDSIYLLTTSADKTYMLCSLRGSLTKDCSTQYNASMSGGVLSAHCSKEDEAFSYGKSEPSATNGVINSDWANVATGWALALSLNAGIEDGNASNARMLSQFIPSKPALEPSLPSIAEALAVLSGCTLLISTIDAPFKHFWNYSSTTLAEPQLQSFAAMVRTQDYSSGGTDRWQNVFHPVLFWTFGLNLICLIYMLPKRMITDFTDPQNMFLLSLNSSASQALEGACGRGPEKEQLGLSWFIKCDAERYHFFIHEGKRKVSKKSRLRLKEIDLSRCLIVRIFKSLFKKF